MTAAGIRTFHDAFVVLWHSLSNRIGSSDGQWRSCHSAPMSCSWVPTAQRAPQAIPPPHSTERGRAGYEKYRREFIKLIWQLASPKWQFDDATFNRSAAAFDNPAHVAIVIHNYRWRLGLAEGEPKFDVLEK